MADAADMAQAYTDELVKRSVYAIRANFTTSSLMFCKVCDEEIPPDRRELLPGVTTCVSCQWRWELLRKVGALPISEAAIIIE
ncbi:TraR/DksA C4-type zinc finger protein [Yersinia ruckeri]